jgi:hypothetical protein
MIAVMAEDPRAGAARHLLPPLHALPSVPDLYEASKELPVTSNHATTTHASSYDPIGHRLL